MTFDDFRTIAETELAHSGGRVAIPISRSVGADLITPVAAFMRLAHGTTYNFLFESVEGGEKLARYSFLGSDPYKIIRSFGEHVFVESPGQLAPTVAVEGTVLEVLKDELSAFREVKLPGMPRFTCGAVGYLGYDVVRLVEHLPDSPPDELEIPDAMWCFYDTVVAFDHVKHRVIIQSIAVVDVSSDLEVAFREASEKIDAVAKKLASDPGIAPEPIVVKSDSLASNMTREQFEAGVDRARQLIYDGDIFQVVLSQRFSIPFAGDSINLYRALRQVNPSPYLFFLSMGGFEVAGSSPEMLVRVEGTRVETMPIAGTRPRGATIEEDRALEVELLADAKEQSEHLMLVDLARNDIGRVSKIGTVRPDRMAYVERFSHVMHIVSLVSGELEPDQSAVDALVACFPAGTLSGAPKVRAMEIIDEIEPTRRGLYGGAIGYIDFSGNLDTCIAIRTMVVKGGEIYVQAGAGIVADSVPEREFDETTNKARALTDAIFSAARGLL